MTQFNTTLTAAAPRNATQPLMARLKRSIMALQQYCAGWLAPFDMKCADTYNEWDDKTCW